MGISNSVASSWSATFLILTDFVVSESAKKTMGMEAQKYSTLCSDEKHRVGEAPAIPCPLAYLHTVCELSAVSRMCGRRGEVSHVPDEDAPATPRTVSAGDGGRVYLPRQLWLAQAAVSLAAYQAQGHPGGLHPAALVCAALPGRAHRRSGKSALLAPVGSAVRGAGLRLRTRCDVLVPDVAQFRTPPSGRHHGQARRKNAAGCGRR